MLENFDPEEEPVSRESACARIVVTRFSFVLGDAFHQQRHRLLLGLGFLSAIAVKQLVGEDASLPRAIAFVVAIVPASDCGFATWCCL